MPPEAQFRLTDGAIADPVMQVVLALVSEHDGELRCIGTGFIVAPGLALTAAHVVDDWLSYQEQRDGYRRQDAAFSVAAFQMSAGVAYRWDVDALYVSRTSDIAFLRFRKPSWWGDGPGQVRLPSARLNFNPPQVGDTLQIVGFPDSRIGGGELVVAPSQCIACVRHVALTYDSRFRPFSHIELDGEIAGGMSGGPCFDANGDVVGVNSKGWSFPLAYVALLWPAMAIQIDLFKTGSFPALDLFTTGDARAVGYRRVQVSSSGQARLGKVDPDALIAHPPPGFPRELQSAINFAGGNAEEALANIRGLLAKSMENAEPLDINGLSRLFRAYFWELDSAVSTSLRLVARRLALPEDAAADWDRFLQLYREQRPLPETLDAVLELGFRWHGEDLFEIRTYADWCRSGVILIHSVLRNDNKVDAVCFGPCWRGGQQIFLPDGLERHIVSAKRFVQTLLGLIPGDRE